MHRHPLAPARRREPQLSDAAGSRYFIARQRILGQMVNQCAPHLFCENPVCLSGEGRGLGNRLHPAKYDPLGQSGKSGGWSHICVLSFSSGDVAALNPTAFEILPAAFSAACRALSSRWARQVIVSSRLWPGNLPTAGRPAPFLTPCEAHVCRWPLRRDVRDSGQALRSVRLAWQRRPCRTAINFNRVVWPADGPAGRSLRAASSQTLRNMRDPAGIAGKEKSAVVDYSCFHPIR